MGCDRTCARSCDGVRAPVIVANVSVRDRVGCALSEGCRVSGLCRGRDKGDGRCGCVFAVGPAQG